MKQQCTYIPTEGDYIRVGNAAQLGRAFHTVLGEDKTITTSRVLSHHINGTFTTKNSIYKVK